MDNYPVLFYGNLVINFVLPFFILMRNTTKRRYGTLAFTAILVFVGHWVDYFYMIKPGTLITAKEAVHHGAEAGAEHAADHAGGFVEGFTLPGLPELGIFIGFTALFIYFIFSQLEKAALVPKNDPYLDESLHHEVQPYE
jgi:Ni/Fe-hydrogenase subunit HybB-like protein